MTPEDIIVRHCRPPDIAAVLDLWARTRSAHASTPDRPKDVERLVDDYPLALTRAGKDYLRQCGARRVTALVAFDDEVAGGFWESAGYPRDPEIGRRVRNLEP